MPKSRCQYFTLSILLIVMVTYAVLYTKAKNEKIVKNQPAGEVPTNYQNELTYLRNGSIVKDLHKYEIDSLSDEQLLHTIHTFLDNADVVCKRKARVGNVGSGGWEICDDEDVRPTESCIIYSFGANRNFEDDVAKLYQCHVYSFDPALTKLGVSYSDSSHVHFYNVGLGSTTSTNDEGWLIFSFSELIEMLGHQGTNKSLDAIRMDIQGTEWSCLPTMINNKHFRNIRQLLVEYHILKSDRKNILHNLKVLQEIERTGFKKFLVHKNPACVTEDARYPLLRTKCYEVHYLKRT